MSYKNILVANKNKICRITINRPKQLNALNKETIKELNQALSIADADTNIRVIILTGSENKAFVAGADIKEFIFFDSKQAEELASKGQEMLFDFLENLATPSIAAINGFALGGGLELAMSCHIRIASTNAKLGLPETSLGVIPGYGGTQRLSQLVGKGKAFEMILTGTSISAEESKELGLVNQVCLQEKLIEEAERIAFKIIKNSPMAVARAIKTINTGSLDRINGFQVEKIEFGKCFGTEEFVEGTTAFIEKRKAKF